jgi:hypothetical protein
MKMRSSPIVPQIADAADFVRRGDIQPPWSGFRPANEDSRFTVPVSGGTGILSPQPEETAWLLDRRRERWPRSPVRRAAAFRRLQSSDKETAYLARRALLTRQNQGIRELIGEAEHGTIVPTDQFLLGIDEKIIADLMRAGLPLERPVGKHFVVRLEKATVRFTDKYGLIIVDGVMFRPSTPDRLTQVRVHGGLGKVEIDPKTGKLNISIAVDDIDLLQAGILDKVLGREGKSCSRPGDGRPAGRAAQDRGAGDAGAGHQDPGDRRRRGADGLAADPARSQGDARDGGRHKLWVTFDAKLGKITGAERTRVSVGKKGKKK